MKSGLIQIVAEIINRLAREGILERDDAFEYLAQLAGGLDLRRRRSCDCGRQSFRQPRIQAAVKDDDSGEEEGKIEEEPLSQLIERLDATVFGLIEALDADRGDLPRLLDEALRARCGRARSRGRATIPGRCHERSSRPAPT